MLLSYELRQVLLEVSHVSLELGGRPILHDVNATVRDIVRPGLSQGQVVAVLGPSGVGKTQLFRVMAGLEPCSRGRVLVGTSQRPVEPGQVGVVAQNYPLFEHYTILQNLVAAARCRGLDRRESRARSMDLLRRFALEGQRDCFPAILSGGQRQRAAIAQQLLCSNELLLMDEPFSGLDPVMVREVCNLIHEVAGLDELFTIVVVTHDIEAALAVADTVWLLGRAFDKDGRRCGATLIQSIDLIERGIAWRPDARASSAFRETRQEIEQRFISL